MLGKLVRTGEVSYQAYHATQLLQFLVGRDPRLVLDFLMDRIAFGLKQGEDMGGYSPIPFGLKGLFASLEGTPFHVEILRRIRDQLLKATGLEAYWLTKLKMIASGFGEAVVKAISELEQQPDEAKYRVMARLLAEAPNGFLFSHKEFCAGLLERTNQLSQDSYALIASALAASEESGVFTGTPGQRSPKHVGIYETATALSDEFRARPVVADFFKRLAEGAEKTADAMLQRDEEGFVE